MRGRRPGKDTDSILEKSIWPRRTLRGFLLHLRWFY